MSHIKLPLKTLRAKGTLFSEPRFSSPLRDAIFHTRDRENDLFKEKPSKRAIFPFSRGKNRTSQGVENRGSLISVPLALREGVALHGGVTGTLASVTLHTVRLRAAHWGHKLLSLSQVPNVGLILGTEEVPQRNYVTKILPNFRVNFLVRFASKPLFYWATTH